MLGCLPHTQFRCLARLKLLQFCALSDHAVILLVEDLEDDVLLVRKAFAKANLANPLHRVSSGEEALSYLRDVGRYANRAEHPLPDLILLDLKLHGIDGFEVLEWIRNQPGIRGLAVVVLTSTEHLPDVNRAYALGANSFLVKPADFENYMELGRLIRDYWLKMVRLPETYRPTPRKDRTKPAQ